MTNLKQFVEQNDFSTGASLPKGDTFISVNADIKEIETELLKLSSNQTKSSGIIQKFREDEMKFIESQENQF
jgi:hypothetical protein